LESPSTLDKYVLLKDSKLKILKPVQVLGMPSESESSYLAKKDKNSLLGKKSVFLALKRFVSAKQIEAEAKQ
jgi:hypothetical protein